MPWGPALGAGISAAGAIGGGLLGSNAAKNAASAQQASQQKSLDWIQQVYGQTRGNMSPYIGAGQGAIGSLLGFYGLPGGNGGNATQSFNQFQQTPFYQFPLEQANLATNRALAASGLIGSGGALRDLSKLNSGYASQGLGQYLTGLGGIASSGQAAAGNLGSVGVGTGAQIGAANTNYGNAGAQGIYNASNSLAGGINNALPFLTGSNTGGIGQSSYGGSGNGGGLLGAAQNYFSAPSGGTQTEMGSYY